MNEITCSCCGDKDLSDVPFGICYECLNHGPRYKETFDIRYPGCPPDFDPTEAKARFKRDFCDSFKSRGIPKCHCKYDE